MSVEIDIPGGTARYLTDKELTPRRRRPLEQAEIQQLPIWTKIREARRVVGPDGQVEENPGLWGPELVLTDRDVEVLTAFSDKKIIARLHSWTLDLPLPTTVDELLDIPWEVYEALQGGLVKAERFGLPNLFEPSEATLEDAESPTGASAD
jgi:hypothetical protein